MPSSRPRKKSVPLKVPALPEKENALLDQLAIATPLKILFTQDVSREVGFNGKLEFSCDETNV